MKIWMIWVKDPDEATLWLAAAWDDESKDINPSGWDKELAKAAEEQGAQNIRVLTAHVNMDAIHSAFRPADAGKLTTIVKEVTP